MASPEDLYLLRRRPTVEKAIDGGFKLTSALLATVVAVVLLFILYVVFSGALDSMGRYGWKFLVTSNWNPVKDEYGAFTAIYRTLITSLLSLLIAVPWCRKAIFITRTSFRAGSAR